MKLWIGILTAVLIIGGTVYGVSAMEHEEKLYREPIEKIMKMWRLVLKQLNKLHLKM